MASLLELRSLFGNGELSNKVEAACIIVAEDIRNEDPGTANHANRVVWAKQAFANPNSIRSQMLMALLAANEAASVATILAATDAVIKTAVANAVNVFADGS